MWSQSQQSLRHVEKFLVRTFYRASMNIEQLLPSSNFVKFRQPFYRFKFNALIFLILLFHMNMNWLGRFWPKSTQSMRGEVASVIFWEKSLKFRTIEKWALSFNIFRISFSTCLYKYTVIGWRLLGNCWQISETSQCQAYSDICDN